MKVSRLNGFTSVVPGVKAGEVMQHSSRRRDEQ
jgi:hypothetical protein